MGQYGTMYIPQTWLPDIVRVLTEALKQPDNLVKAIEEVVEVKYHNKLYLLWDTYNWVCRKPGVVIPHGMTVELVKEAIERASNSPDSFYG